MTSTEINMHRIHLEAVMAYLSGKQEEPDDAPSQHRMAVSRALKDLERINKELEKVRAYNAVLIAVERANQMIYGDQGRIVGKLVRCKDCKHCFVDGDGVRFNVCELNHNKVQPDEWFCADGEEKPI